MVNLLFRDMIDALNYSLCDEGRMI
jgi:hypothetical protein